MRPSEFLAVLWGAEPPGRVQLWRLSDRKAFYPVSYQGADWHEGKPDVYTCVAVSAPQRGGAVQGHRPHASDAVAICGLWLDIDIEHDGKPGVPSRQDGYSLAHEVLWPTIVINSGRGVHAWYLLDEPWRFYRQNDREEAAARAAGWYALHAEHAAQHGWHLDQSTRDLARLMRLPGTVNGKQDPPLPVTVLEHAGRRYTLDDLRRAAPPRMAATSGGPANAGGHPAPTVTLSSSVGAAPAQLIDVLREDAEFDTAWRHDGPDHWSMSEWDLSLASRMAVTGHYGDELIASVLIAHRLAWNPADRKAGRVDYLERTIRLARAPREDEQQAPGAIGSVRDMAARPGLPVANQGQGRG